MYNILKNKVILADGAMGTLLLERGLAHPLVRLNLTHGTLIATIHASYIEAGARIIYTHSFLANRNHLKKDGLEGEIQALNEAAVKNALKARGTQEVLVLGCLGSAGPNGPFVQEHYREQAQILLNSGADGIVVETITNFLEIPVALKAIAPLVGGRVFILSCTPRGNSLPHEKNLIPCLRAAPLTAVGINCTNSTAAAIGFLKKLAVLNMPLLIKPNAGTGHHTEIDQFYQDMKESLAQLNAPAIIGGCCGTTAEYIKRLNALTDR